MRYGVYVRLSDGRSRPYRADIRTSRRAQRLAAALNTDAALVLHGWRAYVLDRDNPPHRPGEGSRP